MTPRLVAVVPLTALVLALSACTGDSEPVAAPEVDPRQQYVEQASEICASADEEFAELGSAPTAPQDFAPYVQDTVGIADRAQSELAALTPPEADREALESNVLTPFAELVEQGRTWADQVVAAGTDQAALLRLLSERPTSVSIDREFLVEYGLEDCADAVSKVG